MESGWDADITDPVLVHWNVCAATTFPDAEFFSVTTIVPFDGYGIVDPLTSS